MTTTTLAAVLSILFSTPAYSQTILTVSSSDGTILNEYSLADLDSLEQTQLKTDNFYIDEPSVFSGPTLALVVTNAGYPTTGDGTIILTAINEYKVEVPVADLEAYNVLLATRRDNEVMSIRDKGPIWVMYPISDYEELQDPIYNNRLIWQLKNIQLSK